MESLITTFHIDWHLIVAQAINFVIVLLVLYFFALKPLKKLMDERTKTIEGGLDNAKKQEELLAKQKQDYDAALAAARAEAAELRKEAKKDLAALRATEMENVQAELAAAKAANAKAMESDKAKMLDEAKKELAMLVIGATEKVVGQMAVGKVETQLVENSIKSI